MIYVFLAHGFEEIEAVTVIDILRRAELDLQVVGVGGKVVQGSHKLLIGCDIEESEIVLDEKLELIVLPGGMPGTLFLEKSEMVQKAIDFCVTSNKLIGAICAAPSILGHKSLLQGKQAVCYQGFEDQLFGAQVQNQPVAVDGKIATGKSAGAALEFALALLELLEGKERAQIMRTTLEIFN